MSEAKQLGEDFGPVPVVIDDPRNFMGTNYNSAEECKTLRRLVTLSAQRSMERTFVTGRWFGFSVFMHSQYDVYIKLGLAIGEVDIDTVVGNAVDRHRYEQWNAFILRLENAFIYIVCITTGHRTSK